MLSKLSRQLITFHVFYFSSLIELREFEKLFSVNAKTFHRDLKDLQDAGLLRVKYSSKEGGYTHVDERNHCPFKSPNYTENKARSRHLDRLIRMAVLMIGLRGFRGDTFNYENEQRQETCSTWYLKKFPDLSIRTMQRDFNELREIGYEISYDTFDKIYYVDFPEGLEDLEWRLSEKRRAIYEDDSQYD